MNWGGTNVKIRNFSFTEFLLGGTNSFPPNIWSIINIDKQLSPITSLHISKWVVSYLTTWFLLFSFSYYWKKRNKQDTWKKNLHTDYSIIHTLQLNKFFQILSISLEMHVLLNMVKRFFFPHKDCSIY